MNSNNYAHTWQYNQLCTGTTWSPQKRSSGDVSIFLACNRNAQEKSFWWTFRGRTTNSRRWPTKPICFLSWSEVWNMPQRRRRVALWQGCSATFGAETRADSFWTTLHGKPLVQIFGPNIHWRRQLISRCFAPVCKTQKKDVSLSKQPKTDHSSTHKPSSIQEFGD